MPYIWVYLFSVVLKDAESSRHSNIIKKSHLLHSRFIHRLYRIIFSYPILTLSIRIEPILLLWKAMRPRS